MSFGSSSILSNKLLAWSMGNGGGGYVRLEFPFDMAWYRDQPSTKFRSFQHRKEAKGLRHEFIVLQMTDGSICRVERMGDPDARFNALSAQGSIAHDLAQCFRPECIAAACLGTTRVVAEVELPNELDLKDVLNICRAIQEAGKTRKYTLQTFNCYFFSLALQSCLTRLITDWEYSIIGSYETWVSDLEAIASSLAGVNVATNHHVLFHALSVLYPQPNSHHRFTNAIQDAFQRHASLTEPQDLVNETLWYHEIGDQIEQFVMQEVNSAWWDALNLYLDWTQNQRLRLDDNAANSELELLVSQYINALRDIVGGRNENSRGGKPRKLQPSKLHCSPRDDAMQKMDYKGIKYDEYERVESLTIAQWLVVLWLHARQTVTHIFGLFAILSIGLWVPSYHRIYVEDELERIFSNSRSSDTNKSKELKGFLDKLCRLSKDRNLVWKESPWTRVQRAAQKAPRSLTLGQGPQLIKVALEGQNLSPSTVSAFQKHILQRTETQAKLVERVGLGRSTHICSEIQRQLSLVWATIRNDDFDSLSHFPPENSLSSIIPLPPGTIPESSPLVTGVIYTSPPSSPGSPFDNKTYRPDLGGPNPGEEPQRKPAGIRRAALSYDPDAWEPNRARAANRAFKAKISRLLQLDSITPPK